ncbi:hypothetical protein [Mesorhizobium sp. CN2-181]|uniref:hypothetical protein n=1 Tax=Mesorhizobium yinganensis TaxID=3157707 RepID=UPI0032B7BE5E
MVRFNSGDSLLLETLEQAGISAPLARQAKILNSSSANSEDNERVHRNTNTIIFELLRNDELGTCIHVTGGARALTDPFHRRICEAMLGENKQPFQVLYHVPSDRMGSPWDLVSWNLEQWEAKGLHRWQQKLLTIDMIGRRGVDLKGQEAQTGIQYSVFGDRYVQLQAKHSDTALAKPIWLLESENINGILREQAQIALDDATEIDEGHFHDFVGTLHSNLARAFLAMIGRTPGIDKDGLLADRRFYTTTLNPEITLDALCRMAFVLPSEHSGLTLTDSGRSFFQDTEI